MIAFLKKKKRKIYMEFKEEKKHYARNFEKKC